MNILDRSASKKDDKLRCEYSPVRHLVTALFQFSCKSKYMQMLTAYMDETGHSQDEKQHFNGMAGLMAPTEYWEVFEGRWDRLLTKFKLPHIHMKEMWKLLDGWSKTKTEKLSAAVWKIIKETRAIPIGSIIPMDDFRFLEENLRRYALD